MKQIDKLLVKAKELLSILPHVFVVYSQEEANKTHQEHGDDILCFIVNRV